jgi:hypothetical protein
MNFKTTIFLLIMLVVVGAFVMFTQRRAASVEEQAKVSQPGDGGQKIIDLGSGTVQSLTITSAQGDRTSIEKAGTGWKLTEPVPAPAVEWQTTDLVRELTDLRSQGRPESVSASDTGFDQPRYRVDLNTSDGKTIHVVIGNNTGVGDVMYAQVDGGDANLIDAGLSKTLKSAATDLRDKKLFTITSAAVTQFTITSGNQTLAAKLDNGKWKVTEPVEEPGDSPAITSLLSTITTTDASEFVKPDFDEVAFARFENPLVKVWLSTNPPSTQPSTESPSEAGTETMAIGAPDSLAKENYFVRMSNGLVAKVPSSFLDNFKKTPLDLRDKDVMAVLPAEVKDISIVKETYPTAPTTQSTQPSMATTMPSSTQTVELTLRPKDAVPIGPVLSTQPTTQPAATQPAKMPSVPPSKWQFAADSKAPADDAKVDTLLEKFNPLHADKFLAQAPKSARAQRYLVTLNTGAASSARNHFQIELVRPTGGDVDYAICDGLTFEISAGIVDAIDADFHKTPGAL